MLAAIIYNAGFPIDGLVLAIADSLRAQGVRLRGVAQENAGSAPCAAMKLVDLATGKRFLISQDLGADAQGCRLDPRGLAEVAASMDAGVDGDFDLLVINKFGKSEAEGGGLRTTFAHALSVGKPVLSSVRAPYLDAWSRFHGGLAADLMPDIETVVAWCRRAIGEGRFPTAASVAASATGRCSSK